MFDVAIIGAGVAGLTVGQQLRQAGYRVVVVEKSRGVGGRDDWAIEIAATQTKSAYTD
ncbi:MAG: FAD-dependent oxidoreductase [Phormidium sp.]